MRIINFQKSKSDKRIRHENVKLKETLKEYKQKSEQLLVSAVVLWYEKIFLQQFQRKIISRKRFVRDKERFGKQKHFWTIQFVLFQG